MTTPPGWYDDGHGAVRWWDGAQWSEHVHAPEAARASTAGTRGAGAPVGYPGAAGWEQGGVSATPEKKKSKLWILWVVLGAVVLALVGLSLVLIPLLVGLLSGSGASAASADQQAAISTVKQYDHAWRNANCDEYFGATTESFRAFQQIEDCDTFSASSDEFTASTDDYALVVTAVEAEDGQIVVETRETYNAPVDENGEPLDEPTPVTRDYRYTLVSEDGSWLIDDANS